MSKEFTVQDIDNIDRLALDEEWLRQPAMYRYFATIAEEARRDADKASEALKVVDAEIDKELRYNASMNEAKVTEKSIANEIIMDKRHTKAMEDYLEAEHEARVLNNANKMAMDHRKKALEYMCQLELANYNSTPKQPREVKENIRERAADKHQMDAIDKKSKKRSK
jgi:hypothetical protein